MYTHHYPINKILVFNDCLFLSFSKVTEQPDEPTEFEAQTLSKWVSESTDRWSVVVTLCVVVGVVLIIIGIVCFFVCAKKRKMNEGVAFYTVYSTIRVRRPITYG